MTDIIVPTSRWVVPGGVVRLDQPGQRLVLAPGLTHAEVIGGAYITAAAVGATIGPEIRFVLPAGYTPAPAIDVCAHKANINCEIDLSGQEKHGVIVSVYPAGSYIPEEINFDNLYVYNNTSASDPGKTHGIYLDSSLRAHGKNLRFKDLKGGYGLHFFPRPKDSLFEQITSDGCLGDVIFWGTEVERNVVKKLLSLNVGAKGVVIWSNSTPRSNTCDYVTTPTPGYGYQAGDSLPLRKIAETATTVTFGWTPPVGAVGYRFSRSGGAGKFSHTWDGTRSSVKFAKDSTWYKVEALSVLAYGQSS